MQFLIDLIRNSLHFHLNEFTFAQILILKWIFPLVILYPLKHIDVDLEYMRRRGGIIQKCLRLKWYLYSMIYVIYFIIFEFLQNI